MISAKGLKIFLISVAAVGAVFIFPATAKAAGTASVTFSPNSVSKSAGESLPVNIIAQITAETATGVTIEVNYDPNNLEAPVLNYVTPVYPKGCNVFPENSTSGRFRYSLACGPQVWTVGTQNIGTVTFRVKTTAQTTLSFGQVTISGANGNFGITSKGTATINPGSSTPPTTTNPPATTQGTTTQSTTGQTSTGTTTNTNTNAGASGSSQTTTNSTTGTTQSTSSAPSTAGGTTTSQTDTPVSKSKSKTGLFESLFQSDNAAETVMGRALVLGAGFFLGITLLAFTVYWLFGRKV